MPSSGNSHTPDWEKNLPAYMRRMKAKYAAMGIPARSGKMDMLLIRAAQKYAGQA